ncbi:nuclear transport factor 2 family protein [Photobacterium sp. CCB-ST2H9]|uniref:nuclear transport factor 2 family protein n=1 Tax=unclassified Photobacterium TaxID=2628852 RepID=UPI0020068D4A|nr:nuclear transport factor 2 family protein [Photobacterium sp. CCB-ST2H9]UTM59365.1 nuclear transport factor 2 family protein [Photobacterium sp. CCB-ST2H9]
MNLHNIRHRDLDQVTEIIQTYFEGIHHGDTEKLSSIFHADAVLKAPDLRRSVEVWLEVVRSREKPHTLGAEFAYRILSADVIGDQAMVKVLCPLLGHTYIDFLGLLKENGQWRIVNKMYADLASN